MHCLSLHIHLLQRLVNKFLSNLTLKFIQILLFRFLHHGCPQIMLHLGHLIPHKLLQLLQLFLGQLLQIKLIFLRIAVKDDVPDPFYMLLRQSMDQHRQLPLFLTGHRLRISAFPGSSRRFLLFLLLLGRSRWRFDDHLFLGSRLGLSRYPVIVSLELMRDLDKILIGGVEEIAVVEYLLDVLVELGSSHVHPRFQIALQCRQVHRLFHYLPVLGYSQPLYIHRLQKWPRAFMLFQLLQYFKAGFYRLHYYLLPLCALFRLRMRLDWNCVGIFGLRRRLVHGEKQFLRVFLLRMGFFLLAIVELEDISSGQDAGQSPLFFRGHLNPKNLQLAMKLPLPSRISSIVRLFLHNKK